MKKKLSILAFSLCLLTFGVMLTACSKPKPTLAFVENATLTREYNGEALTTNDIATLVENKDTSEITIKFYQDETEVSSPTNAGTYKIVVSNAKDTIEENFVITPKALKNVATLTSVWSNGTGERPYVIANTAKLAGGVLVGDNIAITVKTESYELNAPVSSVIITGEDAGNYTLAKEDVIVNVSLKATVTSSEDEDLKLTVYLKYGDNNIYTNLACTTLLSNETLTETFGNVSAITNGYNKSVVDFETMKLSDMVEYAENSLSTDMQGRWLLTNGNNANSISFTAQIAE